MYEWTAKLEGITSLFLHQDAVLETDRVQAWRKDPKNKASAKGDDRFPPWTWRTYLYVDGADIVLPAMNITAMLSKGGTDFSLQGSRKSLKAAAASLIVLTDVSFPLSTHKGKPLQIADINAIDPDMPFEDQIIAVEKLGFVIDVRRVTIGTSKHIRCRPRLLPGWTCTIRGQVIDENKIPKAELGRLFEYCGTVVGLGDWRPGAPKKPGPHGKFVAKVK